MEMEQLLTLMTGCGAQGAASTLVERIPFRREFRAACEVNTCGKYGTCWMCPPDVGDIDALMEQAKGFRYAAVYQSIHPLEDSFDIEGMLEAGKRHQKLCNQINAGIRGALSPMLHLGAGSCGICDRCTRPDKKPCRHPDMAIPSLESYGVAVSELAKACGLNYINGVNTVTYFGAVLFGEA